MSVSNYEETQENEIVALRSIFLDDFEDLPVAWKTHRAHFAITLYGGDCPEQSRAVAKLRVRFSPTYPDAPPDEIAVENVKGVDEDLAKELTGQLRRLAEARVGMEMVFNLADQVQDFLRQHNAEPKSLHQMMEERILLEKSLEREAEERFAQQKEEKLREERERLLKTHKEAEAAAEAAAAAASAPSVSGSSVRASTEPVAIQEKSRKQVYHHQSKGISSYVPFSWKRGSLLARGTFIQSSCVFKAVDEKTHTMYAVKEITFPLVGRPLVRIKFVAKAISDLSRLEHDSLVRYVATEVEEDTLRVFQEYVAGGTLATFIAQYGAVRNDENIARYTLQIVRGVAYLHHHGVAHGAISNQNIMFDQSGNLKLADFGIPRIIRGDVEDVSVEEFEEDLWNIGSAIVDMATCGAVLSYHLPDDRSSPRPDPPRTLSSQCREFVTACFQDGVTAGKLLMHPFLRDISREMPDLSSSTASRSSDGSVRSGLERSHSALLYPSHGESSSRYETDFEEISRLGAGAYGEVVMARNKLDGRLYAIKKVKLKAGENAVNKKMLREVTTLANLHHEHVVRYYQAWVENASPKAKGGADDGGEDDGDSSSSDGLVEWRDNNDWKASGGIEYENESEDDFIFQVDDDCGVEEEEDDEDSIELGYQSPDDESGGGGGGLEWDELGDEEDEEEDEDDILGYESPAHLQIPRSLSRSGVLACTPPARNLMYELGEDDDDDAFRRNISFNESESSEDASGTKILYIQMEYCKNETLDDIIQKGLPAKENEESIMRLFRQILEGLSHIHSKETVHRDLKPQNIFIDEHNNCQIGDFGLATTGRANASLRLTLTQSLENLTHATSSKLSTNVGTIMYCAPEVDESGHYDQSVDMFSLGVILYEMCRRFDSQSQRLRELSDVRNGIFPESFVKHWPTQVELIKWLTKLDPTERPTASTLLKSSLIPLEIEKTILSQAFRQITTPNTTEFNLVLNRLFSREQEDHLTYTYFNRNAQHRVPSALEASVRREVQETLREVFESHGGFQLDTPLLLPKVSLYDVGDATPAEFIDKRGSVVVLPFDLMVSFASFVGQHDIRSMRRFTFSKVYRKNVVEGHPREWYAAHFDLVGPHSTKAVQEAELLAVTSAVMNCFVEELRFEYEITINHGHLLHAILEFAAIPKARRSEVCELLQRRVRYPWKKLRPKLLDLGLKEPMVARLRPFSQIQGSITTALQAVGERLAKGGEMPESFRVAKRDLEALESYMDAFGIQNNVILNPFTSYKHSSLSGFMFQVVIADQLSASSVDVVAAGGTYDDLVSRFQTHASGSAGVTVCGVNIAYEKLVVRRALARTNEGSATGSCDVLVCSMTMSMLQERIRIATSLWAHRIRAEYLYPPMATAESMFQYCKAQGIRFMVLLKADYRAGKSVVRVKDVSSKRDEAVSVAQLPEYIGTCLAKTTTVLASSTDRMDRGGRRALTDPVVVVLDRKQKGGKMKGKTAEEALRAVAPLVDKVANGSMKVLAGEIPLSVVISLQSEIKECVATGNTPVIPPKFLRYRPTLQKLFGCLAGSTDLPFIVVYSTIDKEYHLVTL